MSIPLSRRRYDEPSCAEVTAREGSSPGAGSSVVMWTSAAVGAGLADPDRRSTVALSHGRYFRGEGQG